MQAIYDSEAAPFQGLFSAPSPKTLRQGQFSVATNVRQNNNAISVRPGVTALLSAGPSVSNGVFVGGTIEVFGRGVAADGTVLALAGIYDPASTKVDIWANQYGATGPNYNTWGGWFKTTASSGPWGDTRLSMPVDGPLQFARIPTLSGADKFVVQSGVGTDKPRVLGESTLGGGGAIEAKVAHAVQPVLAASAEPPVATMKAIYDVAGGSWTHSVTAGGNTWTTTTEASSPNQYLKLLAGASGIDSGKASQSILGTGKDLTDCRQVCFIWSCEQDADIWKKVKVELCLGATPTYLAVLDPANNVLEAVTTDRVFVVDDHNFYMTAMPIPPGTAVTDVRGFRITAAQDLIANTEILIAMFAGSGRVPGGAEYGLAFENSYSGVESPGLVLLSGGLIDGSNQDTISRLVRSSGIQTQPSSRGEYLMTGVLTEYGGDPVTIALPIDTRIYYEFQVPVFSPTSSEGALGVNYCNIYRRDPGEEAFVYVTGQQTSTYSGGAWTYVSPFTAFNQRQYYADNTTPSSRNTDRVLPDEFCAPPPPGYALVASNNRLYVGTTEGSGNAARAGVVWVSEEGRPLRFRPVSRWEAGQIAQEAGFTVSVGASRPQALLSVSGALLGVSAVYCLTQDDLWGIDNSRARRLQTIGTLSPKSVAERDGSLVWLSDEVEAVELSGNPRNLSRDAVSDFFEGVPSSRRQWLTSTGYKDRWLMAFTPAAGSNNTRVLVYNRIRGYWESCDSLPAAEAVAQWSDWNWNGSKSKAYFTPTGSIMQWDLGSTDNGTAVSFTLTSKEFLPEPRSSVKAYRMTVEGDANASAPTLTCRRTFGSTNVDGTVTLETSGITRKFDASSGAPVGGRGESVFLTLLGTPGTGWKLFRWQCDLRNALAEGAGAG
jgi:hypothetical protein